MPVSKPTPAARPCGTYTRRFLFYAAAASLLIALASRTFHLSSTIVTVAQSHAHATKVQQLANDGHSWSLPTPVFFLLLAVAALAGVRLVRESSFAPPWYQCLFNRPPPSGT